LLPFQNSEFHKINRHHHISNIGFGDINLLDTKSCSTGEIVYQLLAKGDYEIDKDIATLLWLAIVTDTGRFAYSNTTPQAMHAAAEVLHYGVNTEEVDRKVYRQLTRAELNIRKTAIHNLQFSNNDRIAFVALSTAEFDEAGCTTSDTEDIIEIPRCVDGVDVAILFYEDKENLGRINVSMRSNGSCDVSALCGAFDGGGHTKAAGCRIIGDMKHAQELILQAVGLKLI
jgi:phosphoesterase RecJ-like protein